MHNFDIVLTKTFFSSEFVTIQSIFTSSKSFISQKQHELKITFEISKIKRTKFEKISKTEQIVKSTLTFQNINIFDSTLTFDEFEFDFYNETTIFLQHFQQCRHLYRKSDLLNLLSKCLCDFAFDWFKIQFEFTSLKRFNTILTKTFSFAKTFSRRVSLKCLNFQLCAFDVVSKSIKNASNQQIAETICKFCKQNFNFNNELYEHIRKHEILKFVENFHFSINAINLIYENEKKLIVSYEFFFHLQLHSKQSFYWNVRIFQFLHSKLYSNRWKTHRYNVCSFRFHHMYYETLFKNVRNSMFKISQLTIHFSWSIRSNQRAKSRKNQQRVDIANKHSISKKCFVNTNANNMRKNLSSIHIFRSMQSNQHANR